MKKQIIYIVILLILAISCESDYDLEKSIHVPDPQIPTLPAYSEWGYNTFGALFDRKPLFSDDYEVPLKIINTNDTTTFLFTGKIIDNQYVDGYYHGTGSKPFRMKIRFPDFDPQSYLDFLVLEDSTITIDASNDYITMIIGDNTSHLSPIGGGIHFKRVQHLLIDGEESEVIISGTFFLQIIYNGEPVSISNGRFDIGVAEHNFFRY